MFTFENIFGEGVLIWILPQTAFYVEYIKKCCVVSWVDKVAHFGETEVAD